MSFEARVAMSATAVPRDEFGRFIELCKVGGHKTVEDIANHGRQKAIEFAPKGRKRDKRTSAIKDSMIKHTSGNTARWGSFARHALPQETGSIPHDITGRVTFFWEREGRMWHPGDNTIKHPGNPATHYLQRSYAYVMSNWGRWARANYPN